MPGKCALPLITGPLNALLWLLITITSTEVLKLSPRLLPTQDLLESALRAPIHTITGMTAIPNNPGSSNHILCMGTLFRTVNPAQPGSGPGECEAASPPICLLSGLFRRCWSFASFCPLFFEFCCACFPFGFVTSLSPLPRTTSVTLPPPSSPLAFTQPSLRFSPTLHDTVSFVSLHKHHYLSHPRIHILFPSHTYCTFLSSLCRRNSTTHSLALSSQCNFHAARFARLR